MNKNYNINNKKLYQKILPIPSLILLLIIFFIPLLFTLSRAFIVDENFSLSLIKSTFSSEYTQRILLFTINQAFLSTLISLLIGLPGAYLLTTYDIKAKKIILGICTIPFVLPSILVILGFVSFYGNNGFLNRFLMNIFNLQEPPLKILYSYKAIIMAHAFFNFPVILLLTTNYCDNLDPRLEMSSTVFGATKLQTFFNITLPRIIPSILSSSLLVFLFCFTSFSIILVLGGGPQYTTIEVEIYRRARISMDLNGAVAYSLVSIFFCIILLLLYNLSQNWTNSTQSIQLDKIQKEKKPATVTGKILTVLYAMMTFLFVLSPIISIVLRSLYGSIRRGGAEHFTLYYYKQLFGITETFGVMTSALPAIITSLKIALTVGLLTIPVATMLAVGTKRQNSFTSTLIELIGMLPLAISSVIIGLGYYLIAAKVPQASSTTLVILAHLVIALPFALRVISPELKKLPKTLSESAMTLGATPFKAFLTIELPLIKNALISSAIFAFAISIGEINATLVLASSKLETIPVIMYRLIGSYNFSGACALGTILILICAIIFITTEKSKRISL